MLSVADLDFLLDKQDDYPLDFGSETVNPREDMSAPNPVLEQEPEPVFYPTPGDENSDEGLIDEDPEEESRYRRRTKGMSRHAEKLHRRLQEREKAQKELAAAQKNLAKSAADLAEEMDNANANAGDSDITTPKKAPKEAETTGRTVAPKLWQVLPAQDRVRISRIETDGKQTRINDYNLAEIGTEGDIEAFIDSRIRPTYGDAEYIIHIIDGKGNLHYRGKVGRREVMKEESTGVLRLVLDTLRDQQRAQAEAAAKAPVPKSMAEELGSVLSTVQGVLGNNGKLDPTMLMMLPMLQQMAQPQRPPVQPNGTERMLERLTEKLFELERKNHEIPMPALPPITTEDEGGSTVKLVAALAELLKPKPQPTLVEQLTSLVPVAMPFIPLVKEFMEGSRKAREAQIDMMREELRTLRTQQMQAQGIVRTPKQILQEYAELQSEMRALIPQAPPQQDQGGSFWDFMQAAMTSLPGLLSAAKGSVQQAITPTSVQPQALPPAQPKPQDDLTLEVPDDIKEYMNAIENAENDNEALMAYMNFLQRASNLESWKKFIALAVFRSIRKDAEGVLRILKGFLSALVGVEVLKEKTAEKLGMTLQSNIDIVMSALSVSGAGIPAIQAVIQGKQLEPEPEIPESIESESSEQPTEQPAEDTAAQETDDNA